MMEIDEAFSSSTQYTNLYNWSLWKFMIFKKYSLPSLRESVHPANLYPTSLRHTLISGFGSELFHVMDCEQQSYELFLTKNLQKYWLVLPYVYKCIYIYLMCREKAMPQKEATPSLVPNMRIICKRAAAVMDLSLHQYATKGMGGWD